MKVKIDALIAEMVRDVDQALHQELRDRGSSRTQLEIADHLALSVCVRSFSKCGCPSLSSPTLPLSAGDEG
jgi:hypothetical protein